jgi:hypothetical protein
MGAYGGNLGFLRTFTADPIGILAYARMKDLEGWPAKMTAA